jgi:hypothetical protein
MHINAYILAADPSRITKSVLSYYDFVDVIVVSYDQAGRGWTGASIPVDDCLDQLRAIDRDHKMRMIPGDFASAGRHPLQNDTRQRQCALNAAGLGADWVLQIDTDEILPNPKRLLEVLDEAAQRKLDAVEWPMRVFFQQLKDGRFLEVCAADRLERFEYPGPIAVRPGAKLIDARRATGDFLRPTVVSDERSLQICRPPENGEHRVPICESRDAILHFSWARSQADVRNKVASWGHNEGLKSWLFYHVYWKTAPLTWRWMRDFHPFARGLWPALKPWEPAVGYH